MNHHLEHSSLHLFTKHPLAIINHPLTIPSPPGTQAEPWPRNPGPHPIRSIAEQVAQLLSLQLKPQRDPKLSCQQPGSLLDPNMGLMVEAMVNG